MIKEWINSFIKLINDYSSLFILTTIIALIWGFYNKIKFKCLEKASEMVATVEKRTDLSGKEKFALCILWINEDLPKIFKNTLFKSIIENLIEYAYNTSYD